MVIVKRRELKKLSDDGIDRDSKRMPIDTNVPRIEDEIENAH